MARLRYNGLTAALGASLTNSATSVTFAAGLTHSGGTNVPTIAGSDYFMLTILDASGNVSEIVKVTAYTAAATTATIVRGQEGTTGVAHSGGDKIVHAPTVQDISYPITRTAVGTATNPTTTSTTYAAIDTTCDVTIPAVVGDNLLIIPAGRWSQNVNIGWMDAATIVASAIVSYCSGRGSTGLGHVAWMHDDPNTRQVIGAPMVYTVVSGDISGGNVVIRLIWRANAGGATVTMAMDANSKLLNQVVNLGPN